MTSEEKKKHDQKAWKLANPDKVKNHRKTYYTKHPERVVASCRQWEKKNPEKILEIWRRSSVRKKSAAFEAETCALANIGTVLTTKQETQP